MAIAREAVLEAIRKAGNELGRAPSRAELKRLTGVSHFVVLKHFATLRHAVEAAGLTPHIKGRRATTAELLDDYGRVAQSLGRRPSRAEYLRLGRYSAGTFKQRFGGWVEAGEEWEKSKDLSPQIDAEERRSEESPQHSALSIQPEAAEISSQKNIEGSDKKQPGFQLPNGSNQHSAISIQPEIVGTGFHLPNYQVTQLPNSAQPSPLITTDDTDQRLAGFHLPNHQITQLPNPPDPCHQRSSVVKVDRPAFILRPGQPAEIPGMRCVTEEVAAMILGGLLGPRKWRLEIGDVEFRRAGSPQIDAEERRSEELPESPELPKLPRLENGSASAFQLPNHQVTQLPNPSQTSPLITTDDTDQRLAGFQLPNGSNQHSAISIQPEAAEISPQKNTEGTDKKQQGFQLPNYQLTQLPNLPHQLTQLPNGPTPLSNEIFISRRRISSAIFRSPDHSITGSPDVLRRINVQVISGRLRRDRPVMGPPLHHFPLTNAPSNEAGVVALFCMIAPELGFQIEAIQSAFPDCEARRQVRPGKWQRVWIEFEYESRNFALHHHDPSKCDMIVCWRHNWKNCPEGIEVLELRKVVEQVIG